MSNATRLAIKVSGIYLLAGALWILLSDSTLSFLVKDVDQYARVQTFKGWFFVLVTSLLLFFSLLKWASVFFRDVDERKRIEETLRDSEDRYRDLVENSHDLICTHTLDGKLLSVNEAAVRTTGYTREALLQMNMDELLAPEVRHQFKAYLRRIRMAGRARGTMQIQTAHGETRFWTYDNTLRTNGVVVPIVRGMAHDITEQKRADETLRENERLLRESQSMARLGSYTLDIPSGMWKSSEVLDDIFGVDGKYIRSVEGWASLVHPDWREQMKMYFVNEVLGKTGRFDKEYKIVRKNDGEERWVHGVGEVEFDSHRKPVKMIGTILDITERKALERQLFQAQKLESIGTLAGGIAHDFNNVLGIILGYATILRRAMGADDNVLKSIDAIDNAVQRGADLVRQILMFARKGEVTFKPVEVNKIVRELQKMIEETFPKSIRISTDLASTLPEIKADRTQMHQTLLNLCVNARDAMPGGGTLSIHTSRVSVAELRERVQDAEGSDFIRISVGDTGTGMDELTQRKIFEPFFTTKPLGKGTGLGLAVVYGIVKSHQGYVLVQSTPGQGSTFDVFFPVHPNLESSKTIGDIPAPPGDGRETILLVEDEEMLCELLKTGLSAKGFNVLTAADGEEAVKSYEQSYQDISLVISDLALPKLNGLDVVKELKRINPEVKVLIASGFIDHEERSDLEKAGVRGFVEKPYVLPDILTKIRDILNGTKLTLEA